MDDARIRSVLLGAGFGIVLVVALYFVRPAGSSGTGSPLVPDASYPPAPRTMSNEELYAAFASLDPATSYGTPMTLAVARAGDLVLPSGRVVASDAFFVGVDSEAFTVAFPAGRYPVLLLEAESPETGERVAAALIRAAPGDPASWEIAHLAGQDPATLGPDEVFTYGVDGGTAAFASLEVAEAIAVLDEAALDVYSNALIDGMYPAEGVYLNSIAVVVDAASGLNVIAFSSGYGDGGYPSFFGLDAAGRPLVLMTDFGILDSAEQG